MIILGDTCCSPGLTAFQEFLKKSLGSNTYVKSIQIGQNSYRDLRSGYFEHPDEQIADVCSQIASEAILQNGYNAIGFSQGAQFL